MVHSFALLYCQKCGYDSLNMFTADELLANAPRIIDKLSASRLLHLVDLALNYEPTYFWALHDFSTTCEPVRIVLP